MSFKDIFRSFGADPELARAITAYPAMRGVASVVITSEHRAETGAIPVVPETGPLPIPSSVALVRDWTTGSTPRIA